MPRPAKGPRLYLHPTDRTWSILDGKVNRRTGCSEGDREGADKALGAYLTEKYQPASRQGDLARISVAEALTAYGREHAPHTRGSSPSNAGYNIASLVDWWQDRTLAEVRGSTCRAYAAARGATVKPATIRRELTTLSAAINHWHREHGPLSSIPAVTMPDKPPAKSHWLTRGDAAALVAGALGFYTAEWCDVATRRHHQAVRRDRGLMCSHAARFILLGLYTGTRHAAILGVRWIPSTDSGWVDLERGVLHRRGGGVTETSKRQPPVRLGRRILGHLRRWHRLDLEARSIAAEAAPYLNIVAYKGQPIQKMRKPWYAARELAGLDRSATPHILRHTRATWMMLEGIDPWEASGSLGMSVQMLQNTYGHHHPDFQKNAAEV